MKLIIVILILSACKPAADMEVKNIKNDSIESNIEPTVKQSITQINSMIMVNIWIGTIKRP